MNAQFCQTETGKQKGEYGVWSGRRNVLAKQRPITKDWARGSACDQVAPLPMRMYTRRCTLFL